LQGQIIIDFEILSYPTCIRRPHLGGSRRNIAMAFGTEKLEMVWLPDGEKNMKIRYSFWHNARMWRTHRHTHTEIAWRL